MEIPPKVIVRIKTTRFKTKKGCAVRRDISCLLRLCEGHNFLDEEISMVGAEDTINIITNLNDVEDGVYQLVFCNESTDWETGCLDSYEFKLIPYE